MTPEQREADWLLKTKAILMRWVTDTCEPDAETEITEALKAAHLAGFHEARVAAADEAVKFCMCGGIVERIRALEPKP